MMKNTNTRGTGKKLSIEKNAVSPDAIEIEIRELISRHEGSGKLPTVRELMKHFSVGPQTIGKCLEKLEAEGLITKKKGSGTFISRKRAIAGHTRQAYAISTPTLTDRCFAMVTEGFCSEVAESNASGVFVPTEMLLKGDITSCGFSGLCLAVSTDMAADSALKKLVFQCEKYGIPVVVVDVEIADVSRLFVGLANYEAGMEMGKLLAGKCGSVVCVGSLDSVVGLERLNGVRTAFSESGKGENLTVEPLPFLREGLSEAYEELFRDVLDRKPEAVIVTFPPAFETLKSLLRGNVNSAPIVGAFVEEGESGWNGTVLAVKPSKELGRRSAGMLLKMPERSVMPFARERLPLNMVRNMK